MRKLVILSLILSINAYSSEKKKTKKLVVEVLNPEMRFHKKLERKVASEFIVKDLKTIKKNTELLTVQRQKQLIEDFKLESFVKDFDGLAIDQFFRRVEIYKVEEVQKFYPKLETKIIKNLKLEISYIREGSE